MAGKRHVAIRKFYQYEPDSGATTNYEGDGSEQYTGPMDLSYLKDPDGPDGKGPLIAEESVDKSADKSAPVPVAASGDSGSKDKEK